MSTTKPLPESDSEVLRGDFSAVAERRYAEIIATGKTVSWSDMRRWLEDRVAGKKLDRPTISSEI